ncbi:metal-dependent hydrolase [Rhodophyticola sp. CCM32]|uniref:metal-dependent hydrolase n=1 Tax=Rhodophyticola sp. CCM32 TaxID=2916397 RepID=UPI00107F8987|nr:metal-dependent hydrolase [Rhodophyticola sp. CCM32]QBY00288.1 metal-dependent hydrolase [Rhodophyticola sp. CCM32]
MITAHFPSGYVLSRLAGWQKAMLAAGMVGAVWPDLDLIFFYLVDDRAFHHHRYWVHAPAFAVLVTAVLAALVRLLRPEIMGVVLAFGLGWGLHLILDSLAGDIMWLWPMSNALYALFSVPATQDHWMLSFILHWTFLAELIIWVAALWLWLRRETAT